MKTVVALLLAFCLSLARSCAPTPRPAHAPAPHRAAPTRDSSDVRYEQEQKTLVAEWEWYAGGGW